MSIPKFSASECVVALLATSSMLVVPAVSFAADPSIETTPPAESHTTLDNVTDKQTEAQRKKNNGETDVDDLITNNNLRAYSGSKDRLSVNAIFNYNGGTINTPFAEDRPNISQASATTTKADLDGQIAAKFNINATNSLLAGGGVRWVAPLSPGGPHNYNGTVYDAYNPYIGYQLIYKWAGVQSVLQVEGQQWTQADQTAVGYDKQFSIDQENMWQVNGTKLSLGASVWFLANSFNKSGSFGSPSDPDTYIDDLRTVQSSMQTGLTPELEYQISDKYNFRTTANLWVFDHFRNLDENTWFHDKYYQSVGLGISITRDFFLYPNVQFLPEDIRSDLTNVGVTATINL